MTTSILSPCGPLNWYDLQALQDFALEAPYEWRRALEELIEGYERVEELEELEVEVATLKEDLTELEGNDKRVEELEMEVATLKEDLTELEGKPSIEDLQSAALLAIEEIRETAKLLRSSYLELSRKAPLMRPQPGLEKLLGTIDDQLMVVADALETTAGEGMAAEEIVEQRTLTLVKMGKKK